jgi:hypothetical protein
VIAGSCAAAYERGERTLLLPYAASDVGPAPAAVEYHRAGSLY